MQDPLPPLQAVTYLVVARAQNPAILDEFAHSYVTLRRFHPDVPVFVYHQNLTPEQLDYIDRLHGVMTFPIAVDGSGRFAQHGYLMKNGIRFPELFVLAAKVDVLLLTPGNTLFLDTDTEVRAPLDEVFASDRPWMHADEGLLREHDRDWSSVLDSMNWNALGWRGDLDRLRMFNSGSIWVPETLKRHLYKAKEFLWSLVALPAKERGDNRLDEQLALSVALQEACDHDVGVVSPRVYHYWLERYEGGVPWYPPRFDRRSIDGEVILVPPTVPEPEIGALTAAP